MQEYSCENNETKETLGSLFCSHDYRPTLSYNLLKIALKKYFLINYNILAFTCFDASSVYSLGDFFDFSSNIWLLLVFLVFKFSFKFSCGIFYVFFYTYI